MITGYNTDVDYQGRTYHVQTEDKGLGNPIVESLVYTGGQIVDSVKSPYDELAARENVCEEDIQRRMEDQHRRLIREIRNGRYDPDGPKPFGYNIITNRSLDQVVLEFLENGPDPGTLEMDLEGAPTFRECSAVKVEVKVFSSEDGTPRAAAEVKVKLICSSEKPVVLFEGHTDREGSVAAEFKIPPLGSDEAAILFQVAAEGANTELKQLVLPAVEDGPLSRSEMPTQAEGKKGKRRAG